jgi:hypothetical protein
VLQQAYLQVTRELRKWIFTCSHLVLTRSECVLQVQCPPGMPQKDCPFCLRSSFATVFRGVLSEEEIRAEREEQVSVAVWQYGCALLTRAILQNKVEQLQHQARTSETLRRLAVKTSVADEKGKAEQSDKPATPQPVAQGGSSSASSSSSSVTGTPSPGHEQQDMHNSEEDDPDLRLAISLSLGRDW